MKKITFNQKFLSIILAVSILLMQNLIFQSCSYKEDYSVMNQNDSSPHIIKIDDLEPHEIALNDLINRFNPKTKSNTHNIGLLATKFGTPLWNKTKSVEYAEGYNCTYTPFQSLDSSNYYFIASKHNNSYNALVIEIHNKSYQDPTQGGYISVYKYDGEKILSLSYINGQLSFSDQPIVRVKSSAEEAARDCNFSCAYNCFNNIMTSDWIYGTACGASCIAWETAIGLFICIFCVGGPALKCIEDCCPGTVR